MLIEEILTDETPGNSNLNSTPKQTATPSAPENISTKGDPTRTPVQEEALPQEELSPTLEGPPNIATILSRRELLEQGKASRESIEPEFDF